MILHNLEIEPCNPRNWTRIMNVHTNVELVQRGMQSRHCAQFVQTGDHNRMRLQTHSSPQDLSMGIKAKRMVVCVVHNLKITRIPNCMECYVCTTCISMYTEWSWHQWRDKEESHWILWVPGKYCSTRIMLATLYCGPLDIRWQLTSSCHGLSYSRYVVFQNPGLLL